MIMSKKEISIIIPTLNEEKIIRQCLGTLVHIPAIEVIVADGGSTDRTVEIAGQYRDIKVVSSTMGRSKQMNEGATYANGKIILFLHADCILSKELILNVQHVFRNNLFVGGAFRIKLLSDKIRYRLIEKGINFRAKVFKLPYGDQGLFVKRSVFEELGGFREMSICEDLDFVCRLKKQGKIIILDGGIAASIRRWENNGILRTYLRNQSLLVSYVLGRKGFNYRYSQCNIAANNINSKDMECINTVTAHHK